MRLRRTRSFAAVRGGPKPVPRDPGRREPRSWEHGGGVFGLDRFELPAVVPFQRTRVAQVPTPKSVQVSSAGD
jgi:hypothetical protein